MRTVICFGNLKQAALYFDRVLPVAFSGAQGTGKDIIFQFPEEIPARALSSIVYGIYDPSKSDQGRLLDLLKKWGQFVGSASAYRDTVVAFHDDDYRDYLAAYLRNAKKAGFPSMRACFQAYAESLGLQYQDALLSQASTSHSRVDESQAILSLARLPLINVKKADWDQIVELRKDPESGRKLMRLRSFLVQNYVGKSTEFIRDDLGRRLDEYERTVRKHGFATMTGTISVLLDSDSVLAAASVGIGAAFLGGPLVGLGAAGAIQVGKIALEVAKKRHELIEWKEGHELAYVIDAASSSSS